MKLYYSPGACSLSPHIALLEAGLNFTTEKVDIKSKKTESGGDFTTVNSKGSVPALVMDDGNLLTEGAAIVQYIADQKPQSGLAPANGTLDRYRLIEWLNYIATEMHKGYSPLFNPATTPEARTSAIAALDKKFAWLTAQLGGKPYLLGDTFTVADGYLFTVLSWSGHVNVDLGKWPALTAYSARIAQRPKVQEALKAEGLLH